MIKKFNSLGEMRKYYDEKLNAYVFKENNEYIDLVVFNFDLNIVASIVAHSINAKDIDVFNITARDIKACDINACNINANDIIACDINTDNISAYNISVSDINASNINANDINAWNISAWNINANSIIANNISAENITSNNISYYAVCFAYNNIKCKSIKGRRENAKHFVLDGILEVEE